MRSPEQIIFYVFTAPYGRRVDSKAFNSDKSGAMLDAIRDSTVRASTYVKSFSTDDLTFQSVTGREEWKTLIDREESWLNTVNLDAGTVALLIADGVDPEESENDTRESTDPGYASDSRRVSDAGAGGVS